MSNRSRGGHVLPSIDPRAAVGFACTCAWGHYLTVFAFPASAGRLFSPLAILLAAAWLPAILRPLRELARPDGPPSRRILGSAIIYAAATFAGCLSLVQAAAPLPISAALACATGGGLAWAALAWAHALSRLDARRRFGTALAALPIFGCLDWAAEFVPEAGLGVMALACAAIGIVLLHASGAETEAIADQEPPTVKAERLAWSTVRPFRRFVGAYLVYAFVFGITFGVSGFYHASGGFGEQACIAGFGPACVIGGCLLLVAFAVRQEKFGLGTLSQIISPLLAALFLLHMLFDTLFSTWLPSITFSLWWIVLTFLFLTMVDLVWRTPSDGRTLGFAVCWALVQTALAAGAVTAQVTSFVFGTAALTANAITACSLVLVVIATAMLVGAPTPFSKTPDELGCAEGDAPHAAMPGTVADPLLGICADIARTHDLTSREEEVLVLLAQGHTRNGIARKLVVSDNTVRAHVKSIYHKLHIHSKQELMNIVDARRAAH